MTFELGSQAFVEELLEQVIAAETSATSNQVLSGEAEDAYSEDLVEQTLA